MGGLEFQTNPEELRLIRQLQLTGAEELPSVVDMLGNAAALAKELKQPSARGLQVEYVVFPEGTHNSVIPLGTLPITVRCNCLLGRSHAITTPWLGAPSRIHPSHPYMLPYRLESARRVVALDPRMTERFADAQSCNRERLGDEPRAHYQKQMRAPDAFELDAHCPVESNDDQEFRTRL